MDTLAYLAHDAVPSIRAAVGANLSTESRTLTLLSFDGRDEVRSAVAGNRYTETKSLGRLALDPADTVREAVANNKFAPAPVRAVAALPYTPEPITEFQSARSEYTQLHDKSHGRQSEALLAASRRLEDASLRMTVYDDKVGHLSNVSQQERAIIRSDAAKALSRLSPTTMLEQKQQPSFQPVL